MTVLFHGPVTPGTYTLSLHDALPIFQVQGHGEGEAEAAPAVEGRPGRPREGLGPLERGAGLLVQRPQPFPRPPGSDRRLARPNSNHSPIPDAAVCLQTTR